MDEVEIEQRSRGAEEAGGAGDDKEDEGDGGENLVIFIS